MKIIGMGLDFLEWLWGVLKWILFVFAAFLAALMILFAVFVGYSALCDWANGPDALDQLEIVQVNPGYSVYRDTETNVMYVSNKRGMSVMLNENGTPKIYEEANE